MFKLKQFSLSIATASAVLAAGVASSTPAQAAFIDAPVPANAKITFAGLEWAWANPCAPTQPTCGEIDLSYQSQLGWRLPTLNELLNRPSVLDFVFNGANVPQGGTDPISGATFFGANPGEAALATPYFSNFYRHGDWGDGNSDLWAGLPNANGYWETLVVRDTPATPVPTPALLPGLLGLSLGVLRKRKATQTQAEV